MRPSDVVIIGPNPLRLLGGVGLAGIGITVGGALLLDGLLTALVGRNVGRSILSSSWWIIGATAGTVVGCVYMLALLRRWPRVEIRPDGFVVLALFGSRSRCWSDIDGDFVVIKVPLNKVVAYRLTKAFKDSAGIKPTTLFAGNDEAISGAYAVPVAKLAELLNQHKVSRKASSTPERAEPAHAAGRRHRSG